MFTSFFIILWIIQICGNLCNESTDEVNRLVDLIEEATQKAEEYQVDRDGHRYSTKKNLYDKEYGNYDFIIIGSGSAGSIVANHLSQIVGWKVLLLEAGEFGEEINQITSLGILHIESDYNWGYSSIPQKTCCLGMEDKRCVIPRGRGVGGSSLLNGVIYQRGSPHDYDLIESKGNPGWSYKSVLPLFLKEENYTHNLKSAPSNPNYHQTGGSLPVEYQSEVSLLAGTFYEANKELGFDPIDINSPNTIGTTPSPFNTHFGSRYDTGRTFVKSILGRPNLEVKTGAFVTKIIIDEKTKTATGVQFSYNNKGYTVYAKKEVILSAGVISSPQILMLSGVGPRKHLESQNINVIHNLEVGSQLKDHSTFWGLSFTSDYYLENQSLESQVRDFLQGKGPLTIEANVEGLGFYSIKEKRPNYADLELIIVPPNATVPILKKILKWTDDTYDSLWGNGRDITNIFQIYITCLHCYSSGSVRLKSNNPFDYPLIDAQFLSDPENHDIDLLYEGIELSLKLVNTEAFKKLNVSLNGSPLPACKEHTYITKEYWYCALREMTYDLFHPVGSCPMGPNPEHGAVVNHELKVHGIKNLRIADASIFPETLSGHTSAPSMMVGAKVVELIKEQYLLRNLHTEF